MAFFFWGIIALAFCALWVGTLLLFIASRFSNSKVLRWLGVLPLAGLTTCVLWLIGMMYNASTPPKVFETTFGFAPTSDVRELQSKYWYFGDSGETFLKFKAAPQTIQRIVKLGLDKKPIYGYSEYSVGGSDEPVWWKRNEKSEMQCYAKSNRLKDFATEEEMLCYDEKTGQAYYSFTGID